MLDTQDAQVMPVICRKHFCGATAAEACGISDARLGWWFVGSPPGWGAPSCTGMGVPTAVDPVAFSALWFPTWLLEQFSRIKHQKSSQLEEHVNFFGTGGSSLTRFKGKVLEGMGGWPVFPSLSLPPHNRTETHNYRHWKICWYLKNGSFQ